jgi:hypothetical protein
LSGQHHTLEEAEKSLAATNSLRLEKLLCASSQEVRQTIDYAWTKIMLAISLFLAGQFVLLLIAARLFKTPANKRTE